MRLYIFFSFLFSILTLAPSCSKISISLISYNDPLKKVFIRIPKSNFVFDNIAPLLHRELTKHYRRVGYTLMNNPYCGYELVITIISLTPQTKFVSPDVLLFHSTVQLVLDCTLYDSNGKEQARKTFSYSSLINKSRNSILRSSFLMYEYQKLLQRSVSNIEHYFRPFF